MSEVSTSRRAVMRALAILPATLIAPPTAHAAVELVCSPASSSEDRRWLVLLAAERRANAEFEAAMDEQNRVYGQYLDAVRACEDDWQDRFDARRFPLVPEIAGETPEAREVRVQAAVQRWNAEGERLRNEKAGIKPRLREQFSIDAVDHDCRLKADAHKEKLKAIAAYPAQEAEIIAHKLRIILQEYGDDSELLRPLLASLDGEGNA